MQDLPFHHYIETLEDLLPYKRTPKKPYSCVVHQWQFFSNEQGMEAGYAVVSLSETIEAKSLPQNTTNQQAELFAVKHAFELATDCSLTLYTDSKYALHILLSHSAICKER